MNDPKQRRMQTIAECWETFSKETIPADSDPETVARAKMVFYAGVAFMYDQNLAVGDPAVDELIGEAHLKGIGNELSAFAKELGRKVEADEKKRFEGGRRGGGKSAFRSMH